jgi:hypothetical protein
MDLLERAEFARLISQLIKDIDVKKFRELLKEFVYETLSVDISSLCDAEFLNNLAVFEEDFEEVLSSEEIFDVQMFFYLSRGFYFGRVFLVDFVQSNTVYKFSQIYKQKIKPYLDLEF